MAQSPAAEMIASGVKEFSAGHLEAALTQWRRVLLLDPRHNQALAYIDYVETHGEELRRVVASDDEPFPGPVPDGLLPSGRTEVIPDYDDAAGAGGPYGRRAVPSISDNAPTRPIRRKSKPPLPSQVGPRTGVNVMPEGGTLEPGALPPPPGAAEEPPALEIDTPGAERRRTSDFAREASSVLRNYADFGEYSEDGPTESIPHRRKHPPSPYGSQPTVARPRGADAPDDDEPDDDAEAPADGDGEHSFTEDIPTLMRDDRVGGAHTRARRGASGEDEDITGPGRRAATEDDPPTMERGDFGEGTFSEDMPTRTRNPSAPRVPTVELPRNPTGPTETTGLTQPRVRSARYSEDAMTMEVKPRERSSSTLTAREEALLDPRQGLDNAKRLFIRGDHEESLDIAMLLKEKHPTLPGVSELMSRNRRVLEKQYIERLGGTTRVPRAVSLPDDVADLDLDPRAAFVLNCIDGAATVEEILAASGMGSFEAIKILVQLQAKGLVSFDPS